MRQANQRDKEICYVPDLISLASPRGAFGQLEYIDIAAIQAVFAPLQGEPIDAK